MRDEHPLPVAPWLERLAQETFARAVAKSKRRVTPSLVQQLAQEAFDRAVAKYGASRWMKMSEPEVLTEQNGVELVQLLNELTTLTHRTLVNDLFLHYHEGNGAEGWRAKAFGLGDDGQQWLRSAGATAGLLDALREQVAALREEQAAERKAQRRTKRSRRRTPKAAGR